MNFIYRYIQLTPRIQKGSFIFFPSLYVSLIHKIVFLSEILLSLTLFIKFVSTVTSIYRFTVFFFFFSFEITLGLTLLMYLVNGILTILCFLFTTKFLTDLTSRDFEPRTSLPPRVTHSPQSDPESESHSLTVPEPGGEGGGGRGWKGKGSVDD